MDWKRLISVLSEERAIYEELLDLSAEKRDAVYERHLEQLDAVVRREQAAAARLDHYEKQRFACMDAPEGTSDSLSLLCYADLAPADEGDALRKLHGELSSLLRQLQKSNAENKALIESRLEYARFVIDALNVETSAGLYGSRYGSASPDSGMAERNLFDKKG